MNLIILRKTLATLVLLIIFFFSGLTSFIAIIEFRDALSISRPFFIGFALDFNAITCLIFLYAAVKRRKNQQVFGLSLRTLLILAAVGYSAAPVLFAGLFIYVWLSGGFY
ncbi:MAG: hypothetical protein HZB23_06785 [Deltaproteobacteria bacterium]|nr:hypothetical protein [Deltaproteobacteria bacterium]